MALAEPTRIALIDPLIMIIIFLIRLPLSHCVFWVGGGQQGTGMQIKVSWSIPLLLTILLGPRHPPLE